MKRLAILGSTGSIGTSTLDLVRLNPDRFRVIALAAGRNLDALRRQIIEHRPEFVSVASDDDAHALAAEFPEIEIGAGVDGLGRAACHRDTEMVVSALVGAVGLVPTVAAIRAGKDVAVANKEILVIAGELVVAEARKAEIRLLPIDSEHSAIHQILAGRPVETVRRLVLTASGGPFRGWTGSRMERATIDEALAHPTWRMGPKISVDSATMMNKGFEIIEAHHFFEMAEDRIDVVIHPQSLVHSLVEFTDGTLLAQLSANDMRSPILYALGWPERLVSPAETLDLATVGRLDFLAPDHRRFPALGLARAALRSGGEMPAVLNAANEVAVAAFLAGNCPFGRITATIDAVMDTWSHRNRPLRSIEQAMQTDTEARRMAISILGNTNAPSRVPVS